MRGYWITWAVLLFFTIVMLWVDGASQSLSRILFIGFMLAAMLAKATIIGAYFMHLRHERATLVVTVVVGLLATGLVLFALIAPDALRIHRMADTR